MAATITGHGNTIEPLLVLGWESSTESRNIYHQIIGRVSLDVTLREDSLQAGTLPLLFGSRASAVAARDFLRVNAVYTLTDTDRPELDLTFTRQGSMDLSQNEDRVYWQLMVSFQQVNP